MRIDRLELRAFGPFTGASLDFAAGRHGLHVVYGRNEAGKSSALRGILAALFSIPGQTTDNFVHDYGALRLAMTVRNARGEKLSFVRRKANKKALRDEVDDAPLADDALRAFLPGIDREEFERVFGLDHERLRAGGIQLLQSATSPEAGGAAAAMIGAALGVQDLRGVRKQLDEEASALFRPGASRPEINAEFARWKELKSELSSRSLGVSTWIERKREFEILAARRDDAERETRSLESRRNELELVSRNRARIARRAELIASLEAMADVPDLGPDFDTRRREIEGRRRDAATKQQHYAEEKRRRLEAIENARADLSILDRIDEFEALRAKSIEVAKALGDRERRMASLEAAREGRDQLARGLGLAVPLAPDLVSSLRAAVEQRERVDELVRNHAQLTSARENVADQRRRLALERETIDRRSSSRGAAVDPTPLARAIAAARAEGDLDTRIAETTSAIAEIDDQVAELATRLRGRTGTLDQFLASSLPGPATIADFESRFAELEREEKQAGVERRRILADRARVETEAKRIADAGPVPSVEELGSTRARRDALWNLVRRAWLDGAATDADARAIDPEMPLPAAFERSLHGADRIADRLRDETTRIAAYDAARQRLAELAGELEVLADAERESAVRRDRLERDWRDAWRDSGVEVQSPTRMREVLDARVRIAEKYTTRKKLAGGLDDLLRRKTIALREVRAALAGCGSPVAEHDVPFGSMLATAERELEAFVADAKARHDDLVAAARIDGDLRSADSQDVAIDEKLAAWQESFLAATRDLPGAGSVSPNDVQRALHRVDTLLRAVDDVAQREEQIEKIDRDAAELRRLAATFADALGDALADPSPSKWISALAERIENAKRDRQRRDSELAEIESAKKQLESAEIDLARESAALAALAEEASAATIDELPARIRAADEKRRLREALEVIEGDLRAESLPLAELERRVREFEQGAASVSAGDRTPAIPRDITTELAAELAEVEAKLPEARARSLEHRDAAAAARTELERLEMATGSASIAAELAAVSARVADLVARWARLVVASRLLGCAVERFRRTHEAPLLARASTHFRRLTRDRYRAIDGDVDDSGHPFFVVRDAAGAMKHLESLSDGTRDQLHLALVLGSLELRFEGGAEPMPLVLDDVLVHFDDDRSHAAIEALAEFSRVTQVLLFTHHERIREQAESVARDGRTVFVQDLSR